MGKPRRPSSQRPTGERSARRRPTGQGTDPVSSQGSTWEPEPPLDPADPAPPAETAATPEPAPEPADAPGLAPVERAPEPEPAVPMPTAPVAEIVATPPALPVPIAEPAIPEPEATPAPAARAAGLRVAFTPERLDVAGIGATVAGYVRGESEAVAAHLRALSEARSPADAIRLQVGEIQRAADASLTCWSTVARKVSRIFAFR